MKQMDGAFFKHVDAIFRVFDNEVFIRKAGFLKFQDAAENDFQSMMDEDARMANTFGAYGCKFMANRQRRCLYAWQGWPHRLFRMLLGPEHATKVIAAFRRDWEVWHELQRVEEPTKELRALLDRSVFQLPKVKQWVCALQSTGWKVTKDIYEMAKEKACGVSSSLPIEEFIHYMKNIVRAKTGPRLRRPQRAMGTVIGKELLTKRFHFDAFPVRSAVGAKRRRLTSQDFVAEPGSETVDLMGDCDH